ncbi:MAG: Gfo/Idh/MocA family oxidoreductase [Lewinellaceae bacterium]|nr:Gfo/Idh/MocA family oxidoreductase [Lewinellaceae bacterium]
MKRFALIGAAGYVAPRHMRAIQDNHGDLVAALDPHDAVGVMDSYFPNAAFFTEFERFDRHLDKSRRKGTGIDFLSICSPNYLHDAHIRYGLRQGVDVICEKPLVLNPWNLDGLLELEAESGKKVFTILQLRLHPSIIALRERVRNSPPDKTFQVKLTYITSRGQWYYASWKGDPSKSGGIATNIGIHFFDMLEWVFGPVKKNTLHLRSHDREAGLLELERARVNWFLSIQPETLPPDVREKGGRTYRTLEMDGEALEFSEGFTDLHTLAYRDVLEGKGWGLEDARAGIQIVHDIRKALVTNPPPDAHPFVHLPLQKHPFDSKG